MTRETGRLLCATVVAALVGTTTAPALAQVAGGFGVGTTTPMAALHVYRDDGMAQVLVQEASATPAGRVLFKLQNNGPTRFQLENTTGGGSLRFNFALNNGGDFVVDRPGVGPNPEFLFAANGDLTVAGEVYSASCSPCVSDYVFEPDYELMSLAELETFIAEYRHLPNVPSEAELQAAGRVPLHRMSVLMLEKIEELTLYTLAQQREIDRLRAERDAAIVALERRVAALERK